MWDAIILDNTSKNNGNREDVSDFLHDPLDTDIPFKVVDGSSQWVSSATMNMSACSKHL